MLRNFWWKNELEIVRKNWHAIPVTDKAYLKPIHLYVKNTVFQDYKNAWKFDSPGIFIQMMYMLGDFEGRGHSKNIQ